MLEVDDGVDVFDAYMRGDGQRDRRVAENAVEPCLDELGSDALGGVGRNGHHGDLHPCLPDHPVEVGKILDAQSMADWLPDLLRVLIHDGYNAKAARFKLLIVGDSGSERAGTDENHRPDRVDVEDLLKLPAEEFDVISRALLAEFAEVAEILANLSGADAEMLAKLLAGGYFAPVIGQEAECAQIDRQSTDNDVGDGGFTLRSFVLHLLAIAFRDEGVRMGSACRILSGPTGTDELV